MRGGWSGMTMAAGLAAALLATGGAIAQSELGRQELDRASGTRVEVRAVFDPPPPSGVLPVRVTGTNGLTRGANWTFSFTSNASQYRNSHTQTSTFSLDLPGASTRSAVFLVPLSVAYGRTSTGYGYNNHNLIVRISDTGFDAQPFESHRNRAESFVAIAISRALAENSITRLEAEVKSKLSSSSRYGSGDDIFGSRFDPADLPEDWLGYSGFDFLMISHTEWEKLKPGVQTAIRQWVRLGGRLHVYAKEGADVTPLGLPGGKETGTERVALGEISTLRWNGRDLPTNTVDRYYKESQRENVLTDEYAKSSGTSKPWELLEALGRRSFASWQVIVFLLIFGILIGPINLFVLAPQGRRHRLFVTTPLLSLVSSTLMVGLILVQDGTGGTGRRQVVIEIEPRDASACVTQEQVSRTGVLFGGGFDLKQPALIEQLTLPDSDWTRLKASARTEQGTTFTHAGLQKGGDYFRSRTEQAQLIHAVVSTRARVEIGSKSATDATPVITSALGFVVGELFYVDAQGDVWKTTNELSTGQQTTLEKSTREEFGKWWKALASAAGATLRQSLEQIAEQSSKGRFFAKAAQAPGFTQETLPSLHWKDDRVIVFGTASLP